MEPISAIVISLALGAAATAGKEVVSSVVKDAYGKLKELVSSRYPKVSVEELANYAVHLYKLIPPELPRRYVERHFSVKQMSAQYETLYGAVLGRKSVDPGELLKIGSQEVSAA